jgi:hypothetical protein
MVWIFLGLINLLLIIANVLDVNIPGSIVVAIVVPFFYFLIHALIKDAIIEALSKSKSEYFSSEKSLERIQEHISEMKYNNINYIEDIHKRLEEIEAKLDNIDFNTTP